MNSNRKMVPRYFGLVFILAVPFWLVGSGKLPLPFNLPVSALGTFVPFTAAAILAYQERRWMGVWQLLKKAWDFKNIRHPYWILPALLLPPLIGLLAYISMRISGLPLPDPIHISILMVLPFFLLFFIGDAGEELGWTGYAIDPLQARWGPLKAGLLLGVVWAIWHLIPFVQTGNPPAWIAWQSFETIAVRVLIVWLYDQSGRSVVAAILFHDMTNVSWSLFPNLGSHYDPMVTSIISWIVVLIVALGWRRKVLRGNQLPMEAGK